MDLDLAYGYPLEAVLEAKAPQTHQALRLYNGARVYYESIGQESELQWVRRRLKAIDGLPDGFTDSQRLRYLASLEGILPQAVGPIHTTLDEHRERMGGEENPILHDLTLVLLRCIPFFISELATEHPRRDVFVRKKGVIREFLPLPDQEAYRVMQRF